MSATAQQKFQQILVAAGSKYNVNPNFISSFYYAENSRTSDSTNNSDSATPPPVTGDGNWREPASPYGHGQSWPPPNSFTAQGPFQFINSTWKTIGVDGNGDGAADVNDLTDAAFAAAKYLAAGGGTLGATEAKLRQAAYSYNHSNTYVDSIINTYTYLTGGGQSSVSGSVGCGISEGVGNYQNPLRDIKNLGPARIDEGVDYTGDGPIYAIGNGIVSFAQVPTGWPGVSGPRTGSAISYKLSDGPAAGKTVYVAENCTINPDLHVGSQVDVNTTVCSLHNVYPFMEVGWAEDGTDVPLASNLYQSVPDGTAMAYGVNFSNLLKALGAPAGTYQFPAQSSHPVGTLAAGWPAW
jgi:hypothetical protein